MAKELNQSCKTSGLVRMKTAPTLSPDTEIRQSYEVHRNMPAALQVVSVSFLKCELQIDTSSVFSPSVVGMYFFTLQYESGYAVIQKRYSQFYFLDNYLQSKLPKKTLPSLPPKELLHSGSHPDVIHRRSKDLSTYIEKVIKIPHVMEDTVVVEWFQQPADRHLVSFSKQRKAGYVMKEGSFLVKWKRRYCVLAPNVIALFNCAKDLLVYQDPLDVYCLKGCTVKPVLDKGPNVMTISRNNLTLCTLLVENDNDFLIWLGAIQEMTTQRQLVDSPKRTQLFPIKTSHGRTKTSATPTLQFTLTLSPSSVKESSLKKTQMKNSYEREMKETKFCEIENTNTAMVFEKIVKTIFRRYKSEMNAVFTHYQFEPGTITEEHLKFFEEIKSLQLIDFMEGKRVEEVFQKLLSVSKEYSNNVTVQKILWVFINVHMLLKRSSNEGRSEMEQLQTLKTMSNLIHTSVDSTKMLVCRLCEHQYKMSQFCDHTKLCEIIMRRCMNETTCVIRLEKVLCFLRDSFRCQIVKDTFKYTQLVELVPNLRQQTTPEKLDKINEAIRTLCVDLTDTSLLTFARAISDMITSYKKLLREYVEGNAKNMWSFISVIPNKSAKEVQQKIGYNTATVEDFDVVKKFSAGAYSRIYLVKKKSTGDYYAMKVMKKDDMVRKNVVDSVLVEKDFLSKAHNNSVVKLYWAFQDDTNLYLILEYCPGGDLATLLEHIGTLDEHVAKVYS
ncbi:serine/threonine protein kinase, partial [Entamoeba invadens IP1]